MSVPYIPPGYTGIIRGVMLVAVLRHRERWHPSSMLPNEAKIWNSLPNLKYPEMITDLLANELPSKEREKDNSWLERLSDYLTAQDDLRTALAENKLKAFFFDSKGAMHHVLREGWRSEAGYEILNNGYASLEGEPIPRFLVLVEDELIRALNPGIKHRSEVEPQPLEPALASSTTPQSTSDVSSPAVLTEGATAGVSIKSIPRNVIATIEAMRAIWPPSGKPPVGLPWTKRNEMIQTELKRTGRKTSDSSIKRALRLLE